MYIITSTSSVQLCQWILVWALPIRTVYYDSVFCLGNPWPFYIGRLLCHRNILLKSLLHYLHYTCDEVGVIWLHLRADVSDRDSIRRVFIDALATSTKPEKLTANVHVCMYVWVRDTVCLRIFVNLKFHNSLCSRGTNIPDTKFCKCNHF